MAGVKAKKKIFKIIIIVVIIFVVASIILNGINLVPFRYRNEPVSFLTPDLTWNSKPSDVILKYGFPEEISEKSDITGERTFDFKCVYDGKDVAFSAVNRVVINSEFHRYSFVIDCKTPEEASRYFDECHKKIMDLHKEDPDFKFEGTETETDYEFTDGDTGVMSTINQNGKQKTFTIDNNGNQIPVEEAENVTEIKTKVNNYDMSNTVGVYCTLSVSEGDSSVYFYTYNMY